MLSSGSNKKRCLTALGTYDICLSAEDQELIDIAIERNRSLSETQRKGTKSANSY